MMTLLGLLLLTLFGYGLLTWGWGSLISIGERIALGYGLGLGIFTYGMFGLLAWSVRLSPALILGSLTALCFITGILAWRNSNYLPPKNHLLRRDYSPRKWSIFLILFGLIVYFGLTALVVALYWPVWSWDALAMFDFRARLFVDQQSLAALKGEAIWGAYPLLTSLAHTLIYTLSGITPKIIYPLYYLTLLIVFGSNILNLSGRWAALIFTLLLATTPILRQHATIAYTNLPFTFYYAAGVIYIYRWVLTRQRSYLLLAGLLLGLTAWTRYGAEPLFGVVWLPVVYYGFKYRQWNAPVIILLLFALIYLPWLLYQRYILEVAPTQLFGVSLSSFWNLPRLGLTLAYLGQFLTKISTQGTIWLIFLGLIAYNILNRPKQPIFLLAIIGLGFGAWTASIYLTTLDVNYLAKASGERLLLTFLPIAAFYCAVNPITQTIFKNDTP